MIEEPFEAHAMNMDNELYTAITEKKKQTPINYFLNKELPKKKVNIKISDTEFTVPPLYDYLKLNDINYTLYQLKKICKEYKIKSTGKKDEIKQRAFNHMKYAYFSTKIQKITRKIIVKNYIALHGPGFYNRARCTNDCDFVTLDDISSIPYTQFFSFEDDDKFIYVFDILSIYNLYMKNKTQPSNPFSTKIIDNTVYTNMMNFIKYSRLLGFEINIDYQTLEEMDETKRLDRRILNLFLNMDSLGNYTDMTWFTSLNRCKLIKFARELHDIWHFRASLTPETKREISPPFGNPFISVDIHHIHNFSFLLIKRLLVTIMEEFVNKGIDDNSKTLGCYYVLACLTLVNPSAAETLPWLYESVNY
tara:strand:- start:6664 stop:7752 length:1089 start_codon:yes stop_codon:yes gene_type:complete